MITTTGDLKDAYKVLNIVSLYHSPKYNKEIFGVDPSADDLLQLIIKKIEDKAEKLGADAIIGLRVNRIPIATGMGISINYEAYGTAVKIVV